MADRNDRKPPLRSTHRSIGERFVVRGRLELCTPAHFGNGDAPGLADLPVLLDEVTQAPLLTGASIAGALRSYLRQREAGYGLPMPARPAGLPPKEAQPVLERRQAHERGLAAALLFGGYRGDDEGAQSPLLVYDAPGRSHGIELRDGVAIDPATRTAAEGKKFDRQLLSAGASFALCFELAIPHAGAAAPDQRRRLLQALATCLDGLARGEIRLGAGKTRGFGRCQVAHWQVWRYDLATPQGLLAWLAGGLADPGPDFPTIPACQDASIAAALAAAAGSPLALLDDQRRSVRLQARFALDGSLLIRSGFGQSELDLPEPEAGRPGVSSTPDVVQLHSPRPGQPAGVPVIPGTSWAGVLRSQAQRIAATLAAAVQPAAPQPAAQPVASAVVQALVDGMFGPSQVRSQDRHTPASRLVVDESEVTGGCLVTQPRVKIDHFTGGASESALFSEQALFGGQDGQVELVLHLRPAPPADPLQPDRPAVDPAEIGLLLLLLKDLWTGTLRVGGEAGIGRGRLRGLSACLEVDGQKVAEFKRSEQDGLDVTGSPAYLQECVDALNRRLAQHG